MSALVSVKLRGEMEINGVHIAPDSRVGLLIAYLCSVPFHQASRNEVGDVLWPEKDRERQQLSLRQTLFQTQKLVEIESSRHSISLVNVTHDLAIEDWSNAEVVLKNWTHPWAVQWQDQDSNAIVTTFSKMLESTDEPFQKVEILTKIREFAPHDSRFVNLLKEQYQALGWSSQISLLEEEVEQSLAKITRRDEIGNHSLFIAETIGLREIMGASISQLERLEIALSFFPLFLTQGKLQAGIELITAASKGQALSKEMDLRVRFALIRLLYNGGDRTRAHKLALGLDPQSHHGMECYVVGMAALAKNRFESCLKSVKRGLKDISNTSDLNSALCSLGATASNYIQRDQESFDFCNKGIEYAREAQNRFQEVALRSSAIIARRALDMSFDIGPEILELAEICRAEGFLIRKAHLLGLLGQHYQLKGDLRGAQEALERSIVVSEEVKNEETKAMALDYLGEVLVKSQKYPEAVLTFQQSTLIRRRLGDKLGAATSYRGAGRGLLLLEEFEFSLNMFDRAISLYRSLEHEILEGGCLMYKIVALVNLGRLGTAEEALVQARSILAGKNLSTICNATDRDIHRMIVAIHEEREVDSRELSALYGESMGGVA